MIRCSRQAKLATGSDDFEQIEQAIKSPYMAHAMRLSRVQTRDEPSNIRKDSFAHFPAAEPPVMQKFTDIFSDTYMTQNPALTRL
jgi:hypothetical protein